MQRVLSPSPAARRAFAAAFKAPQGSFRSHVNGRRRAPRSVRKRAFYQIIVFFIGRTQGQAARFKKVAASKLGELGSFRARHRLDSARDSGSRWCHKRAAHARACNAHTPDRRTTKSSLLGSQAHRQPHTSCHGIWRLRTYRSRSEAILVTRRRVSLADNHISIAAQRDAAGLFHRRACHLALCPCKQYGRNRHLDGLIREQLNRPNAAPRRRRPARHGR